MALRRLVQENNAANASSKSPEGLNQYPTTPRSGYTPTTPRTQDRQPYGFHRSPADTPSISSSIPFDWDAAKSRAPPPYATPIKSRARKSIGTGTTATPRKAVIRKKGFFEKIRNIPSAIAFEIALFPQNVPLPSSKTSARILGSAAHVIHFLILATRENEDVWDSITERRRSSWFDWTTPVTLLLIIASLFNTYNLATRTKIYKFHHRPDPLSSPHAKFVLTNVDLEPLPRPSFAQRVRSNTWFYFSYFWRFLLGMQPPTRVALSKEKTSRVQQLEMWEPGEMELELFSIYSPAHTLLWIAMPSSNWLYTILIMGLVGLQLNVLTHSYTQLVKDKQIVSSETMKEYNERFVYKRLNPIRRDVAVMTHQSEVVNVWED